MRSYEGSHKEMRYMPIGLLDDTAGLTMSSEIFVDDQTDAFHFEGEATRTRKTSAEVMADVKSKP